MLKSVAGAAAAAFLASVATTTPADALLLNVQSMANQTLTIDNDGAKHTLEVPAFTPFLQAVTDFAVEHNLTKSIPLISQALERRAQGTLVVARIGIQVSGKDFEVLQLVDESPRIAARRFANENGFVGSPSLDRILRFIENRLNAADGSVTGPAWEGDAVYSATLRLRPNFPQYNLEVLPGENVVDALTGFLERTGFGSSLTREEQSTIVTDLALNAVQEVGKGSVAATVEAGVLTPEDGGMVATILQREEIYREAVTEGQKLFVRIAAASAEAEDASAIDKSLQFPFEAGKDADSALRFAELGLKEAGLEGLLPNPVQTRDSIARELLGQATQAINRRMEARAEQALQQPYLSPFDIDIAVKFNGDLEGTLEPVTLSLAVKRGDDVTAASSAFCSAHEELFKPRYLAVQRQFATQRGESEAAIKAAADDYSPSICFNSARKHAVTTIENSLREQQRLQQQQQAEAAAGAAAATTAGDEAEEEAAE